MLRRRVMRKVGGRRRRVHSGSKRMMGRGTKYSGGRRRHRHRQRGGDGNGYNISGQIPLFGGLIQAIGNAVHGSSDW